MTSKFKIGDSVCIVKNSSFGWHCEIKAHLGQVLKIKSFGQYSWAIGESRDAVVLSCRDYAGYFPVACLAYPYDNNF